MSVSTPTTPDPVANALAALAQTEAAIAHLPAAPAPLSPSQQLDALLDSLRNGPLARDTDAWNTIHNAATAIRQTLARFPEIS